MSKSIIYNLSIENLKAELTKKIERSKERVKAWEKVKINIKKDGSEFKNLSKNFENALIINEFGSPEIKVNYSSNFEGYQSDFIKIYTDKNEGSRTIAGTNWKGDPNRFYLTVAEIKERIIEHINYLNNYISNLLKCKNNLEDEKIVKLLFEVKEEAVKLQKDKSELYYLLWEYLN